MAEDALSLESFGFNKSEIVLLTSITYHAILAEAAQSTSYSRVRKYFQSESDNQAELKKYRLSKSGWAQQWKELTCRLLDISKVVESNELDSEIRKLALSDSKRNAMIVELPTFEPYFDLGNNQSIDDIRYSDADRQNYFKFCSSRIGRSDSFLRANSSFNDCAKKITKAIAGPNWTWAWVGLGAAVLLITAPYIAAAIGGAMGLGGAAATSAGLAFLGGGSLAAGGLGITGGYFALMAGGAILGYGAGSKDYKDKLRSSSKEEILVSCCKLYAVTQISQITSSNRHEICKRALAMQVDCEAEADKLYVEPSRGLSVERLERVKLIAADKAQKADAKALVLRSFRRVMRGDL
jgi:hypothetical protein